jgi:hypothetical protein
VGAPRPRLTLPVLERARYAVPQAIQLAARATAWAARFAATTIVGRLIVAVILLYLAFVITLYALWIGAMLWLVTGRFGIVRNSTRKPIANRLTACSAIAALALYCALHGFSFAHYTAISLLSTSGAVLWFHRTTALSAARRELTTESIARRTRE